MVQISEKLELSKTLQPEVTTKYIPRVPQCLSPRPNWGWGVPIRTTGEKGLALCLLCGSNTNSQKKTFSLKTPGTVSLYEELKLKLQYIQQRHCIAILIRAPIFKRFRSLGIDSEKSIPPAYIAWRPVRQIELSYRPAKLGIDSWGLLKRFTNMGTG